MVNAIPIQNHLLKSNTIFVESKNDTVVTEIIKIC